MKSTNKISSAFTAILAVLILFAATLSGSIANNVNYAKTEKSEKKADNKNKSGDKYYFSKASVEAVFSPIFPSFNHESVEFLPTEFIFAKQEIISKYGKIFDRIPHLEILFEHLNAPNAP